MPSKIVDTTILFCTPKDLEDLSYKLKCMIPLFIKFSPDSQTVEQIIVPPPFHLSNANSTGISSGGISIELPERINELLRCFMIVNKQSLLKALPTGEQKEEYDTEMRRWDAFIPLVIDTLLKTESIELKTDTPGMTINDLKEELNKMLKRYTYPHRSGCNETGKIDFLVCPAIVQPDVKRTAGALLKRCGFFVFSPVWTVCSILIPAKVFKTNTDVMEARTEDSTGSGTQKPIYPEYHFRFHNKSVESLEFQNLKEFYDYTYKNKIIQPKISNTCTITEYKGSLNLNNPEWWKKIDEMKFNLNFKTKNIPYCNPNCWKKTWVGVYLDSQTLYIEWKNGKNSMKWIVGKEETCVTSEKHFITGICQDLIYTGMYPAYTLWPTVQNLFINVLFTDDYRRTVIRSMRTHIGDMAYCSPTLFTETSKEITIEFMAYNCPMNIREYLQQNNQPPYPTPFRYFLPDAEDTQVTMEIINLFKELRSFFDRQYIPYSHRLVIAKSLLLRKILEKEQEKKDK